MFKKVAAFIKNKSIKYDLIYITLIIAGYCLSMLFFFHISLDIILRFILLNIFSIFLPGLAIANKLKICCSRITLIFYSYAVGYGFIILEYFLGEIFNRKLSFWFINLITIIGSVIYLVLNRRNEFNNINNDNSRSDIACFFLFLIFSIFAYSANYLSPDVYGAFHTSRDMQFWVNNTAALKISFPPSNLYMQGNALNYHYFSNIPIAFLSIVYRIDIFTLSFPLYSLTKAFLMTGSVHFLLNTIGAEKKLKIAGYLIILFTTGAENIVFVTFLHHTLLSPFGFDISYAYGIYFISLIIHQWKKEKFERDLFLQIILFWCVCVGAKGPVGTVLLLFPALLCLFWLVRKQWLLAFGYGLSILSIYLVICKYCIGMFSVLDGSSSWQLTGIYTFDDWRLFPSANSQLLKPFIWLGEKNALFAIVIKCFLVNPIIMWLGVLSFLLMCVMFFKRRLDIYSFYLVFALASTGIFGYLLWAIANTGGHSEMYFAMGAMIPLYALIFNFFVLVEKLESNFMPVKSRVRDDIKAIGLVCMVFSMYSYLQYSYEGVGAISSVVHGINALKNSSEEEIRNIGKNGIRSSDVDALRWIRDNTPLDSIILSDKAVITDNTHYYLYGMFCERQQYLEGTDMLVLAGEEVQNEIQRRKDLITDIYNNGGIEKVREEGVDYIVQTNDITPGFIYDVDELILVKNTETMNIYQIRNSTGGE
ncbi:hypothetical protein IMSAGC007_01363 [Lachnospiraceae bacterium]|uniref:hypothetical protein n=1 Tax=Candidatus Merdisoma sp. JLR.KK011 TaxID=3114299 RepID=UPI0014334E9E|nr:hypothetical protein IMSAGC007_01363 [Lachnospiraceae bacterium]